MNRDIYRRTCSVQIVPPHTDEDIKLLRHGHLRSTGQYGVWICVHPAVDDGKCKYHGE